MKYSAKHFGYGILFGAIIFVAMGCSAPQSPHTQKAESKKKQPNLRYMVADPIGAHLPPGKSGEIVSIRDYLGISHSCMRR